MNYPLITEYQEAIQLSDNFDKLSDYKPVFGLEGKPIMSVGNFSVVFKMVDSCGCLHAVKCFTKEQEGRNESYKEIAEEFEYITTDYLTSVKFYTNELFVNSRVTTETEFPVVVMDWVEGMTLQESIENNLSQDHIYNLLLQFSKLSLWLISQPFSHGDIKPDNIIVRDDDTLVLVDYDGMYVPSMKGLKSRESGTPDYRHPSRAHGGVFDEHIDDFSISVITLSLLLLYQNPKLFYEKGNKEGLLFSEKDFYDIHNCKLYNDLRYSSSSKITLRIFDVFEKCLNIGYINKNEAVLLEIPQIFDDNLVQGEQAVQIITEMLWHISQRDYMIHINLTDNILWFENELIKIKVQPKGNLLELYSEIDGMSVIKDFSYSYLKKILMSVNMWDEDTENKLKLVSQNLVLDLPEVMIETVNIFIQKNFPDIADFLKVTISGHTIIMVSTNGLASLNEQKCIYFILANDTFQKNCKRFNIQRVIAIDALTGNQEEFNINNLTSLS